MTAVLRVFERIWLPIALIALWWFASANSDDFYVPPLNVIVETMWRDILNGVVWNGAVFSLTNLIVGLACAIVIGVVLGMILGETKWLFDTISPIIHFIRSVPQTALIPLIIGAFGIGAGPKMWAVAFACVWPIMLNTIDGVRGTELTVRRVSKVYRIPRGLYYRKVVLPSAMPQIVAGIRVALPIGIVVMVVTELFAASEGLGFYILNNSSRFKVPEAWAGALLVGIIGYVLSLLFILFERRVLRWYILSGAK